MKLLLAVPVTLDILGQTAGAPAPHFVSATVLYIITMNTPWTIL